MWFIFFTLDTSHLLRSELNFLQSSNIFSMVFTFDTSHWSILMFLGSNLLNNQDISVISDVSMKFRSASGPCCSSSFSIIDLNSFLDVGLSRAADFVLLLMCRRYDTNDSLIYFCRFILYCTLYTPATGECRICFVYKKDHYTVWQNQPSLLLLSISPFLNS